jgi:hypothetical protein
MLTRAGTRRVAQPRRDRRHTRSTRTLGELGGPAKVAACVRHGRSETRERTVHGRLAQGCRRFVSSEGALGVVVATSLVAKLGELPRDHRRPRPPGRRDQYIDRLGAPIERHEDRRVLRRDVRVRRVLQRGTFRERGSVVMTIGRERQADPRGEVVCVTGQMRLGPSESSLGRVEIAQLAEDARAKRTPSRDRAGRRVGHWRGQEAQCFEHPTATEPEIGAQVPGCGRPRGTPIGHELAADRGPRGAEVVPRPADHPRHVRRGAVELAVVAQHVVDASEVAIVTTAMERVEIEHRHAARLSRPLLRFHRSSARPRCPCHSCERSTSTPPSTT